MSETKTIYPTNTSASADDHAQVCATTQMSDPALMSGAALAYLGDAVMEVAIRRRLLDTGISNAGRLSAMSLDYVRATAQSAGLEVLLPHLTEEEEAVYRRGRNAAGPHPKSATVNEYRRATGLEALFGYLYLSGDTARLEELADIYFLDRKKETDKE